jgi:ABC-type molybdate transport system substrate-binding protein
MRCCRFLVYALFIAMLGAPPVPAEAQTGGKPDLLVFAAASLKNALDDVDARYQ